jgi:hypothetical protein
MSADGKVLSPRPLFPGSTYEVWKGGDNTCGTGYRDHCMIYNSQRAKELCQPSARQWQGPPIKDPCNTSKNTRNARLQACSHDNKNVLTKLMDIPDHTTTATCISWTHRTNQRKRHIGVLRGWLRQRKHVSEPLARK